MKHETKNLIEIPIKDFAKKIICDGHLYIRSAHEGRRFYLLKPGTFIDEAFIKKHGAANSTFDFNTVINPAIMLRFKTLFKELRYLQFEKDLRMKSLEIVKEFQSAYTYKEHFLSFAMACFEEFCSLSQEELKKMHETDLHLFRKALYSAAFAIIIGMTNDFYHYPMLKDFYNLTLCLDIGLCEANYSYFVSEACNKENQNPGSGKNWMEDQQATIQEINVFLNHPERSYSFIKSKKNFLAFPELTEITLYQHELSGGNGFPRGIPKGQVSSWEAIVILSDSLVEICEEYDFECSVIKYLFSFENKKLTELPVQKVYKKMCMGLSHSYKKQETGT